MSITIDPPPEPTAAERVRSVLARAISLSLTTAEQSYDLLAMHRVSATGGITLHPLPGSPLTAQVTAAPRGSLAALLEFTDVAPTATRDRVRARVTLSGWLAPATSEDGAHLRLDLARAALRTASGSVEVGIDELALAESDPLAVEEGAMLTHFADAHDDMVADLLRLAGRRLPQGIVRALPYALDRYGVTLRCEYATHHRDLRVPFPAPVHDAAAAGRSIRRLINSHDRRHHPHSAPR
ncbi:DUF2470 domain-containing protein [Streptomyces alkaliterrae]|uniref:DUF2470 domain-containing protein n=1 Tax=Streptomyces alkaliterrae TaxID=2213162 RepID=A0A5P0YRE9_9ACTN|nr:DUF2470 domain-containing protein [Streptomyces alkaliterrae]MBB1259037.1 DUF2470 domain-containing protein [Streptomyces alkaliterrae]MQS02460.1 DUF2470 domain-containing protein [Streptomyces alkaliterrae]